MIYHDVRQYLFGHSVNGRETTQKWKSLMHFNFRVDHFKLVRFLIPSNLINFYWHAVPKCLVSWLTIIISCKIDLWGNVLLNQAGVAAKNQAVVPLRTVTHTVPNTTPCINPFTTIFDYLTIYMHLHTIFYIGMFVIANFSFIFFRVCEWIHVDMFHMIHFQTLNFSLRTLNFICMTVKLPL